MKKPLKYQNITGYANVAKEIQKINQDKPGEKKYGRTHGKRFHTSKLRGRQPSFKKKGYSIRVIFYEFKLDQTIT